MVANASLKRKRHVKMPNRLAGSAFISLMNPSIVNALVSFGNPHPPTHLRVRIEAEKFELGCQIFNGAEMDITPKQAKLWIKELEHVLRLYEDASKL